MELAFTLLAAHALCDFVLQPTVMGRGKSRRRQQETSEPSGFPPWYYWLGAHALVHGGAVFLVTGVLWLGVVETALHATIDHLKCEGRLSIHQDQLLHIFCKIIYLLVVL